MSHSLLKKCILPFKGDDAYAFCFLLNGYSVGSVYKELNHWKIMIRSNENKLILNSLEFATKQEAVEEANLMLIDYGYVFVSKNHMSLI